MHLKRLYLGFTAILALIVPSKGWAEEFVIAALQAPPYVYQNSDGDVAGILVNMINAAFDNLEVAPVFRISNWARALNSAKAGQVDALIPTIRSPEREQDFQYVETPLMHLNMVLTKHKTSKIEFSGKLETLSNYSVGRVRNALVAPQFDAAFANGVFQTEERSSFGLLALAVANKRLDLIAGDELMTTWAAQTQGVADQIEPLSPPLARVPVHIAIARVSHHAKLAQHVSDQLILAQTNPAFTLSLKQYENLLNKDIHQYIHP